MQETWVTQVRFLSWEDPLEKEMATFSSILAWRIPWTAGGLQSIRSHRVRHDWRDLACMYVYTYVLCVYVCMHVYVCIFGSTMIQILSSNHFDYPENKIQTSHSGSRKPSRLCLLTYILPLTHTFLTCHLPSVPQTYQAFSLSAPPHSLYPALEFSPSWSASFLTSNPQLSYNFLRLVILNQLSKVTIQPLATPPKFKFFFCLVPSKVSRSFLYLLIFFF